uniref:Uncharacterized protein n=1 Tax=Setaria italica TaxID=4555 RepID=K3YFM4_SETIT
MMLGVGGSGQPSCTAASGWISGKSTSPAASTADGARRCPEQRMAGTNSI